MRLKHDVKCILVLVNCTAVNYNIVNYIVVLINCIAINCTNYSFLMG